MKKNIIAKTCLILLIIIPAIGSRIGGAQTLGQQEPPPRVGEYLRTPFTAPDADRTGPQTGPERQEGSKYGAPVNKQDAAGILGNYLNALNNPSLKLGPVSESADSFVADIQTGDDKTLHRVAVNKRTGAVSVFTGRCD